MRSKKHLKKVASKPCMLCGNPESQAHHLLRAEQRGVGIKTGDEWAVPLCVRHHDALHRNGDEIVFFWDNGWGYELVKDYARKLWQQTNST